MPVEWCTVLRQHSHYIRHAKDKRHRRQLSSVFIIVLAADLLPLHLLLSVAILPLHVCTGHISSARSFTPQVVHSATRMHTSPCSLSLSLTSTPCAPSQHTRPLLIERPLILQPIPIPLHARNFLSVIIRHYTLISLSLPAHPLPCPFYPTFHPKKETSKSHTRILHTTRTRINPILPNPHKETPLLLRHLPHNAPIHHSKHARTNNRPQ
jgi:hypothetical protein